MGGFLAADGEEGGERTDDHDVRAIREAENTIVSQVSNARAACDDLPEAQHECYTLPPGALSGSDKRRCDWQGG